MGFHSSIMTSSDASIPGMRKRIWWGLRCELKLLALWALALVPLEAGMRVRRLCMPLFLERLGAGVVFQSGLRITNAERVAIGSHCRFGQGVFITGGGGVHIGDWVSIGPDVKLWSVNHRFDDPDVPIQQQGWELKPVVIEDDVWLAANVFVMPGVTIGRGSVVSACTVVSKSIPPYSLVAGNPGRVVGWRRRPTSSVVSEAKPSEPRASAQSEA
jgi:acetyltransferase-like isoleucine patch superfamily enzyme